MLQVTVFYLVSAFWLTFFYYVLHFSDECEFIGLLNYHIVLGFVFAQVMSYSVGSALGAHLFDGALRHSHWGHRHKLKFRIRPYRWFCQIAVEARADLNLLDARIDPIEGLREGDRLRLGLLRNQLLLFDVVKGENLLLQGQTRG